MACGCARLTPRKLVSSVGVGGSGVVDGRSPRVRGRCLANAHENCAWRQGASQDALRNKPRKPTQLQQGNQGCAHVDLVRMPTRHPRQQEGLARMALCLSWAVPVGRPPRERAPPRPVPCEASVPLLGSARRQASTRASPTTTSSLGSLRARPGLRPFAGRNRRRPAHSRATQTHAPCKSEPIRMQPTI